MEHISAILANCWWMILLSALIAYLLGSINTAVLVTGIVTKGKKDIRQMGSGNAGFTMYCAVSVKLRQSSPLCVMH